MSHGTGTRERIQFLLTKINNSSRSKQESSTGVELLKWFSDELLYLTFPPWLS
jgi:hypothetical protein